MKIQAPKLKSQQSNSVANLPRAIWKSVVLSAYSLIYLTIFGISAAQAATLTVTKTADTNDGACNADCSLREAIAVAANGDTINFDTNGVFAGAQTITLTLGELSVTHSVTISGTGVDRLTISGNDQSRVYRINNSTIVTLRQMSITHGYSATPSQNFTQLTGGGILNTGDLTLINVRVAHNALRDTAIADSFGAGIYSSNRLSLLDSTVEHNSGTGIIGRYKRGGGIYSEGLLRVSGSTISNNSTGDALSAGGGAIYSSGSLYVHNSTFSGNSSRGRNNSNVGGAIYSAGSTRITNSTFTGNVARRGSAICAPEMYLANSIASGNSGPSTVLYTGDVHGTITGGGYNLIGSSNSLTINPGVIGNILNQNAPQLSPLADNGGATQTHALLSNSPALNAGSNALAVDENSNPLLTDQRGGVMSRIIGSAVDIGAYEVSNAEISVSELGGGNILDGGSFDFGQTSVFTPVTKTFTITNNGSANLRLGALHLPAGFTLVSSFPSELVPNETRLFVVRLDANAQSAPSGTLSFDTNDENENPYNFTITGTVGSPPVTSVASITAITTGQYCTPISIGWEVTFTQPITNLSSDNFALVDVNNSVVGERVALVLRITDTLYNVYTNVETGNGQLRLDMVNRNGTNSIISNLPYAGPTFDIDASPSIPNIELLTALPALPNSTGNQLTTYDSAATYRWFLTGGSATITGSDSLQTLTYSVGGAGNVTFTLRVTAANGCTAFNSIFIPVYSVLNPIVTNNDDFGAGSLRQAILEATPGSTITFADNVRGTITLTLGEMLIEKNLTIRGPGADKLAISGNNESRIFHIGFGSVFNLERLTITGGKTNAESSHGGLGGAIYNHGGALTIKDAVVSNSTSISFGGGIAALSPNGSSITIINSTFTGNTASGGGGIYANCPVTIAGSTISGNSTSGDGGGIFAQNFNGISVNLVNSTVANNSAGGKGGGIEALSNASGNAVLNSLNSIVAQNTAPIGPDISGRLISQGYNLVGSTSGMWTEGDQTGNIFAPAGGAGLAPLGYYGGATPTHALLTNSPALNAANNCVTDASCLANNPPLALTNDQRGASRVGAVDIGAFELNNSQNGGNYRFALPIGRRSSLYNYVITQNNSAFNYTVSSGALPNGINLSTNLSPNAIVSIGGNPSQNGIFDFSLTVSDGANSNVTDYRLQVLVPTAATVAIGGRVMTADGRGIRNAIVSITTASGEILQARTSTFGYFRFDDVEVGQTVIVSVFSKRFTFAPQIVSVTEELTELNFVAQEF